MADGQRGLIGACATVTAARRTRHAYACAQIRAPAQPGGDVGALNAKLSRAAHCPLAQVHTFVHSARASAIVSQVHTLNVNDPKNVVACLRFLASECPPTQVAMQYVSKQAAYILIVRYNSIPGNFQNLQVIIQL